MKRCLVLALALTGCTGAGVTAPPRIERPLQIEEVCFAKPPERLIRGRLRRSDELIVVPCAAE